MNGLVELLAAKGLTFGIAPGSPVTLLGNRFAYGVLGHRDVLPGHTACPGDGLASRLADVRTRVAARMAQIVVRPTPSATPRPAASRTSTATTAPPTPPPLPDACVDRVTNGGFESDTDDWIRNRAYYSSWDVHAGRRAMFVGLRDSDPDSVQTYASASQVVHLPATPGRAQLSFVARTATISTGNRPLNGQRSIGCGKTSSPSGGETPSAPFAEEVSISTPKAGSRATRTTQANRPIPSLGQ